MFTDKSLLVVVCGVESVRDQGSTGGSSKWGSAKLYIAKPVKRSLLTPDSRSDCEPSRMIAPQIIYVRKLLLLRTRSSVTKASSSSRSPLGNQDQTDTEFTALLGNLSGGGNRSLFCGRACPGTKLWASDCSSMGGCNVCTLTVPIRNPDSVC